VLTGLTAEGKGNKYEEAVEPITVGDALPAPRWQVSGFPSKEAFYIAADKAARSSAVTGPAAAAAGPAAPANAGGSARAAAPKSAAPAGPASATPTAPLADPSFKTPPMPAPRNQEELAANTEQAKAIAGARSTLLQKASTDTDTAAQSDTYLKAAQQIMQSKGAPLTGSWPATITNEISRLYGGVNATNYQEVAKYLGNAALQNARQSYGSRMSTTEVNLQMNELSPSTHMTPTAITGLISQMRSQAQYGIDSANRVRGYVAAGNDPRQFEVWNQKYFPRETIVGGGPGKAPNGAPQEGASNTSKSGKPIVFTNGHWQYQ